MSVEEKQEFVFIWKIKHFHRIYSRVSGIVGPPFEIEFLKDIEWKLVLFVWKRKLICQIKRQGCGDFPASIPIDYQYEVTNSAGHILKTSDILHFTFGKDYISSECQLINMDIRRYTPEELCLRCRMVIPFITPSMKSSPCSVVGWEAETDIVGARYSFEFSLRFDYYNWEAVERVTVENIPIDMTFKHDIGNLQIELISKIEDKTFHYVWCRLVLKDGKSTNAIIKEDGFQFSNTSKVWQHLSFFNKQCLDLANCSSLGKLNMEVFFDYKHFSSISEIKSLAGNSTSVKGTSLTLNEDGAVCFLSLQQHLRTMLNEKTCADLKLRAEDEVFFAHKGLLATRSPVFKAMLDQGILESKTNTIDVHDVEAKTLKYFLEYLYTGSVDGMDDEMALSLLVVADKYQVSPLSQRCSTFLRSVLCIDNVLNVLLVAFMANQEQLKVFAIEYIVENSTHVLSSSNWSQWVKSNSAIASEVFLKLSEKFDSSSKRKTCRYISSISEIKNFVGDSTTVKHTALTLNKDETNCFLYLQKHLRSMLNEKTYADLKLRVDDEEFFGHKGLLATRSAVFKAMFDHDMLESKTNIVDIHDVDAKTLKFFLEYLYTGTVDGMDDEIALSLLVVADKYQVSPLTQKCTTFLKSVLSIDNVLNVLLVADMVNQEQLKVFAVEYIVENSTQVLSSPNWPQWVKTNSTIASEVLLRLSNKFDNSSKSNNAAEEATMHFTLDIE